MRRRNLLQAAIATVLPAIPIAESAVVVSSEAALRAAISAGFRNIVARETVVVTGPLFLPGGITISGFCVVGG